MNAVGGERLVAEANAVAVAYSGGFDSAALVAVLARSGRDVWPMYVRCGLTWEDAELRFARRFLEEFAHPRVRPLRVFDLPLADVYEDHWSLTGKNVPGAGSPAEDVYLPGRNPLLLIKPAVACARLGIGELALGSLSANPFADARPEFLQDFARLMSTACGAELTITQPFADKSKADVVKLTLGAPVQLALSCIQPRGLRHCGACNKCEERQQAYRATGVPDPTEYAAR